MRGPRAIFVVIFFVVLVSLPFIGRTAFYYRGTYEPSPVARPEVSDIDIPTPELVQVTETVTAGKSVVLIDFAHNNNFKEPELSVLLSRLAARGASLEYLAPGDSLAKKLPQAQGFVVNVPRNPFTHEEVRQIKHFVDSGGKLLLVTDPTRFEVKYDATGLPSEHRSDVASMNMLSAPFGLVFEDDYLYNVTHNAGSYRDIIVKDFADSPITKGLKQATLFAAHSITGGTPVITADKDTRSSLTEKQGNLTVAALANHGRVLGLSDFTFLTEPYSSITNNDQLVSNVADFLVTGSRDYTLTDFPYFYGDQVDLMYTGKEAVGGNVLSQAGILQRTFDSVDKKLTPRKPNSIERDALYIGLYNGTDYIDQYLAERGITITLSAETKEEAPVSGSHTATLTVTVVPTSPVRPPVETSQPPAVAPAATVTTTATTEAPIVGTISVSDLGEFPTESVTLLSLGEENGHNVTIVLAATKDALAQALASLSQGDLSQCLTSDRSGLCPSTLVALPTPASEVYIPPPEPDIPMTVTSEFTQPVEPPPALTPVP